MNTQYVLIKNNLVVQTVFLDNPTDEILDNLKLEYDADTVEISDHPNAETGSSWDGAIFVKPKPYPSWVLDEFNQWVAPVPRPVYKIVEEVPVYEWNETIVNWVEKSS